MVTIFILVFKYMQVFTWIWIMISLDQSQIYQKTWYVNIPTKTTGTWGPGAPWPTTNTTTHAWHFHFSMPRLATSGFFRLNTSAPSTYTHGHTYMSGTLYLRPVWLFQVPKSYLSFRCDCLQQVHHQCCWLRWFKTQLFQRWGESSARPRES